MTATGPTTVWTTGSYYFSLKNRPSIDIPKTGRLVLMALINAVRQITASTVIGV